MTKAFLLVGGIFLPVGLALLGGAAWTFGADREFASGAVGANGTVVELVASRGSDNDTIYRPVVEFADRGGTRHRFTGRVGSAPPAYEVGETVSVLYDGWSPADARIDGTLDRHFLTLILGGLGTVFSLVGGGLLGAVVRRRRVIARLKRGGQPIAAQFIETFRDTSVRVNGRSPFRVACQAVHPGTGKLVRFDSDPIWADPTEVIGKRPVRVLVDPLRPRDYYVDLEQWVDADG